MIEISFIFIFNLLNQSNLLEGKGGCARGSKAGAAGKGGGGGKGGAQSGKPFISIKLNIFDDSCVTPLILQFLIFLLFFLTN